MNLLKKLFGSKKASHNEHVKRVQENTDLLWKFIEQTLENYNTLHCQCAFPRFRQVAAINCVDYGKSFYCSETEGFISYGNKFFTRIKLERGNDAYNEMWQCNKCGSTYDYGWSDFSIHVERSFLKIKDLKVADAGAAPQIPIPLFVGIFGHTFPGHDQLVPVDFETFKSYITELKT